MVGQELQAYAIRTAREITYQSIAPCAVRRLHSVHSPLCVLMRLCVPGRCAAMVGLLGQPQFADMSIPPFKCILK